MTSGANAIRLALFGLASLLLAYLSRRSLAVPRSHGFWRFLAWECIIALGCVNFVSPSHWFSDPFSGRQLASWTLLFGSIVPVVAGTRELARAGRASVAVRSGDAGLLAFERTTQLVTSGIFRWVRHPMYLSLLLLTWGVFLKRPSMGGLALAAGATVFMSLCARAEERENAAYFGEPYRSYMRSTKRFIPGVL